MRPQVRGARENLLSEGQVALYVESVDRRGVLVNSRQGEFLAELVALTGVGVLVDRLREQERVIEAVQPLLCALPLRLPPSITSVVLHFTGSISGSRQDLSKYASVGP